METAPSTDAPSRRPTPELLVEVRTPAEIAIAPDGARVAFSLHATVSERGPIPPSDLWLLEPGDEAVQLTEGEWSDRAPVWSADGSRLAFLSDRVKRGHLLPYVMTPAGELEQVGRLHGSAESVSWSGDGRRLLVGAADAGAYSHEASAVAVTGLDDDPDPIVYRRGQAYRRLFMVDVETGDTAEVGPPDLSVWESDWDGDATVVAMVSEDPMANGWYGARVVRLDLEDRTAHTLYRPEWPVEGLVLSPDGRRAAVVEGYSSDPGLLIGSVMILELEAGGAGDPWPELETVGVVEWTGPDSLVYGRYDSTGTACGRLWLDGRREEAWSGDAFIGAEVTKPVCWESAGGTLLTTHQAHGMPPELARLDPAAAEWIRLTGFNDEIAEGMVFPDIRKLSWTAPDGLEIHGLLLTPRGAEGPLPLIVGVHGGPTWCWSFYFSDSEPNAVLLADAGYAVLLPNPRGSAGRGHAFARAVIGNSGTADLDDIMAGVDACIAEGVADPDRLAISGLSYGGYMAAWAITQTDRFGASVALSTIGDYVTFHLTSEVARYDEMILGGSWNDPSGPYIERSPIFHMAGVRTPTLVIQGQADRCTPVGQGEELYAALEAAGTEAELVIYPREGHVTVERDHAIDVLRRTQGWFDRHLRPDG